METKSLVIASFMGAIAAILQSAGNWLPGVGYVISAFSTLPIVLLCFTASFRYAFLGFVSATFLLLFFEPTEAFVFPFTTGLLGLCLGKGMRVFQAQIPMVLGGAIPLWLGILFLLHVIHFPVLGPDVSSTFHPLTAFGILLFCLVYSWIWVKAIRWMNKKYFSHFLPKR